jgi:hypothetical protein
MRHTPATAHALSTRHPLTQMRAGTTEPGVAWQKREAPTVSELLGIRCRVFAGRHEQVWVQHRLGERKQARVPVFVVGVV